MESENDELEQLISIYLGFYSNRQNMRDAKQLTGGGDTRCEWLGLMLASPPRTTPCLLHGLLFVAHHDPSLAHELQEAMVANVPPSLAIGKTQIQETKTKKTNGLTKTKTKKNKTKKTILTIP